MTDLHRLSIERAAELLAQRAISSVELTRALLERIRTTDAEIQSFMTVTEEVALAGRGGRRAAGTRRAWAAARHPGAVPNASRRG